MNNGIINQELQNRIDKIEAVPKIKRNPLMEPDTEEEQCNGWKSRSEMLQSQVDVLTKTLDDEKKKTEARESTSKALCDAAIAMVQKDQEIWNHKDFRSVFALAEAQGFRYNGPIITESGKALVAAIQEFQKVWN